jgi:hypothetical protein
MTCRTLLASLFILSSCALHAQQSHFGLFYNYGAHFNIHPSNSHVMQPADGSSLGMYYHLDNGVKALGFRATFAWRWNDVRYEITDHTYVINSQQALELKLQCVLPISNKNSFALGISPRMITNSSFSLGYSNRNGGHSYEEEVGLTNYEGDLNELNSALAASWYHQFSPHFCFALHMDQDMLTFYRDAVTFPKTTGLENQRLNARLTSLTASLIFTVK